jgi:L-lactate dehydrogenase complex protein LldF
VKIDIPTVLVHLRGRVVREVEGKGRAEKAAMQTLSRVFGSRRRYEVAQKLARLQRGPLAPLGEHAPGIGGWTTARDLPEVPAQTFREWWRSRGRSR